MTQWALSVHEYIFQSCLCWEDANTGDAKKKLTLEFGLRWLSTGLRSSQNLARDIWENEFQMKHERKHKNLWLREDLGIIIFNRDWYSQKLLHWHCNIHLNMTEHCPCQMPPVGGLTAGAATASYLHLGYGDAWPSRLVPHQRAEWYMYGPA